MTEYCIDPVCTLSAYNYKFEVWIDLSSNITLEALFVFDTGAGPNVICADNVPDGTVRGLLNNRQVLYLNSASTQQQTTFGVVSFTVALGLYTCG